MKLAVIKNPMRSMAHCRELFFDIIELKLKSFSEQFGDFYISVDKSDFVGDYYYVVDTVNSKLVPVMGFQIINSTTMKYYDLKNPMLHWIEDDPELCEKFITDREFAVVGGLFLNPSYAKNTKDVTRYRSMMYSMVPHAFVGLDVYSAAATRNFAHKLNQKIGFKALRSSPIFSKDRIQEAILPMYFHGATEHLLDCKQQFKAQWEDRIEFNEQGEIQHRTHRIDRHGEYILSQSL